MAGKTRFFRIAILACLLATRAGANDDVERITDYRQDVALASDGTLTVEETVTVNAQGDSIKHGIFRDFPTIYLGSGNVHVRFDVIGATLDGRDSPFAVRGLENGRRVLLGDPDSEIPHGLHRFTLRYVTDRQVGFFTNHDELYWNVTGNGWDFRIDRVSAVVHLPSGAKIMGWQMFTGGQGERGSAARAQRRGDDTIAFQTTAALDPEQGLTIVVDFAKGAVTPASQGERWRYLLRDNQGAAAALVGLILLLLYCFAAWWLVGRDPSRGTIIPLYAPPRGLSPAAMRYIHLMRYDRKALAATLISLAVKGVLTIAETKHFLGPVYTLKRTGRGTAPLSRTETAVADALIGWDGDIELTQKNQPQIAAAIGQLKKTLSDENEFVYFNANQRWLWPAFGIIGASCAAAAAFSDDLGGAFLVFLWSGLFGVATGVFGTLAFNAWRTAIVGHGAHAVNLVIALVRTLFALPFAAVLIGVTFFLNASIQPVTVGILVLEAAVVLAFHYLLRAPTRAGAKLRDEIDGFALYLKTAEQPRLETPDAPQVTPERFEALLPYAIALDCENQWSRAFESAMAAAEGGAGQADHRFYVPMWYQGDAFNQLGAGAFASAIGVSLGSAAASASMAPGSSSGSSGGFSGGGGGGGGGGGW